MSVRPASGSFGDGFACSSKAENGGVAELPALLDADNEVLTGALPVPICGTIAITAFTDRTVHCKPEAKISGLETLPGLAPARTQLKTFKVCTD